MTDPTDNVVDPSLERLEGARGPDEATKPLAPRISSFGTVVEKYALVAALILLALAFHLLTDGLFISSRNIPILLRQTAVLGIVTMGSALILIMGELDLSIGSAVGLCAVVVAFFMERAGWSIPVAILGAVGVGVLIGLWQGFAISVMRVPAFVVTLAGLLIYRGISLVITQGTTIASFPREFQLIGQGFVSFHHVLVLYVGFVALYALHVFFSPSHLRRNGSRSTFLRVAVLAGGGAILLPLLAGQFALPTPVLIMGIVGVVLAFIAAHTRFGRHLYAIGGNRLAAQLSGVKVGRDIRMMYLAMGVFYALTGVILAARLNGASPVGAPFLELDAVSANVIGGVRLGGGVGTVGGAFLGALLLSSVANGLSLMNVPTFYQFIASGVILIFAVFLDLRVRHKSES